MTRDHIQSYSYVMTYWLTNQDPAQLRIVLVDPHTSIRSTFTSFTELCRHLDGSVDREKSDNEGGTGNPFEEK